MAPKHRLPVVNPFVIDRREALRTLSAGVALAACGVPAGGNDAAADGSDVPINVDATDTPPADTGPCAPLSLALGAASNYAVGTWTLNQDDRSNPVVVGHDARGFFVMTAVCPHDFCTVDPPAADGSIVCRCHNAHFDGNGALISGPPPRGLDHFAAAVCNGMLTADPNTVVSADVRTPG